MGNFGFWKLGLAIHDFSGKVDDCVSDLFFGYAKFRESGFDVFDFSENALITLLGICFCVLGFLSV